MPEFVLIPLMLPLVEVNASDEPCARAEQARLFV